MSDTTLVSLTAKIYLDEEMKGKPLDTQENLTRSAWLEESPNLQKLFKMTMPKSLTTPCCASFIVHKDRVLKRERYVYETLRQWLIDTLLDDYFSSRIMEYSWHVLFGEGPKTQLLDIEALKERCNQRGLG
jgi:hypothetical protein